MTTYSIEEFFHDFRQDIIISAETNADFQENEFSQVIANDLIDEGTIQNFTSCYYRDAQGRVKVNGYDFNDISLDLFITDFSNREKLESLTQTEVNKLFGRVKRFFIHCLKKEFYERLEETSIGYELARNIYDNLNTITKVNFYLFSERLLSDRLKSIEDEKLESRIFSYHIWDISRLHRLSTSKSAREPVELNISELIGENIPCLPVNIGTDRYNSFLLVIPAFLLADIYENYGARLLEQNVRSFLQVKGAINKGIRKTIKDNPEMFFAYNNGITATARSVSTIQEKGQLFITSINDLQIVNGGQTTASLFHTSRKDKVPLDNIFVQMKLTVINDENIDDIVSSISEYANTQNKVTTADFSSNRPFHIRMEELSRKIWAPTKKGAQRETKWFYERARGQYADAQNRKPAEKNRFKAEYPKDQMFTKTDLAKFENVWEGNPVCVNLGAQKNFVHYANRITSDWEENQDEFNNDYYKKVIAKAIIFRRSEKIIFKEEWYGGYRANIVAYTLGILSNICAIKEGQFNFIRVWEMQDITPKTEEVIKIIAKTVYDDISNPREGISNIGEWCKKNECWERLKSKVNELMLKIPSEFMDELIY